MSCWLGPPILRHYAPPRHTIENTLSVLLTRQIHDDRDSVVDSPDFFQVAPEAGQRHRPIVYLLPTLISFAVLQCSRGLYNLLRTYVLNQYFPRSASDDLCGSEDPPVYQPPDACNTDAELLRRLQ